MELARTGLPAQSVQTQGWDSVIDAYLNTRRAENTRRAYGPRLYALAAHLGGDGPADVTGQQLAAWGQGIRAAVDVGTWAPNTGKAHIMAARSFFGFARTVGQATIGKDMLDMVLPAPRDQVIKPFQVLSPGEAVRILGAVAGQDRRIIGTLLYSGIRESELCKLRKVDYYTDEQGRLWLKVRGKGGKGRVVPVGSALAPILGVPVRGDGPLFKSRQGKTGHYKARRIAQIVAGAVMRAQIDKPISPHSLRHTAAITWLRAGVPVTVVQKWLGHSDLSTTQKYLDHIESGEAHGFMP